MTESSLPLADLLALAGNTDFLGQAAETVVQMLMGADFDDKIGASGHGRSGERITLLQRLSRPQP